MSDECPTIDQLRERIRIGIDEKRMKEATAFVDEIDRLRAENDELRAELRSTKELQRLTRENRDFLYAECVNLEDAKRELRAEINALNMSHSITVGELRAKLATMVCGTCKGTRSVAYCDCGVPGCGGFKPCPVCKPKEGT